MTALAPPAEPAKATHHNRKRILSGKGFQLRYALLTAGALFVLLLFAGVHGLFVASSTLPPELWSQYQKPFLVSTTRLFLVGALYVCVVTLAAIFLSHRAVGPAKRLEEEVERIIQTGRVSGPVEVREGDEFEGLVRAINRLVARLKGPPQR